MFNVQCSSAIHHRQNPLELTNGDTDFWQSCPAVASDKLLETGIAVISAVPSLKQHLQQTVQAFRNFVISRCTDVSHSVLPCHTRIAKCFTNKSKLFRCEVTFENKHTLCPWIHYVRTLKPSAQLD